MKRTLLLLCAVVAACLIWFVPRAWLAVGSMDQPSIKLRIESNFDATRVASLLAQHKIIDSALGYRLYTRIDPAARHPKPGTYSFHPPSNYRFVSRILAIGPGREEVVIKIIEGWSLKDEIKALKEYGVDSSVFLDASQVDSWKADFTFLHELPTSTSLEGYLFPDTYRVWKDQLPQSLIRKQLEAFSRHASSLIDDANRQGRSIREIVILASLIEKEVANPRDRKLVAGIFWNRLRDGMPLQSDATINYITNAGRTRPTLRDLAIASLYNTYQHKGLPPGPIAHPGADALEAALHPERTSYRYFLTDDRGKTYFARTFEEHIRNRRQAFGD